MIVALRWTLVSPCPSYGTKSSGDRGRRRASVMVMRLLLTGTEEDVGIKVVLVLVVVVAADDGVSLAVT